jgi:hypothetical protein
MKNIFSLLLFLFVNVLLSACCDCDDGRITDQLDTFRTLDAATKDLFYLKSDDGDVYKMEHVGPENVDYSNEDDSEISMSAFQNFTSFFIPTASAAPGNHCQTGDPCTDEEFAGQDRKSPKTSIYKGTLEIFDGVEDLRATLSSDDSMRHHLATKLSTACDCGRVKEEQRHVKIKKAYLYGIYREDDNDYHVIIGNGKWGGSKMKLFNIEISGLPEHKGDDYDDLEKVRAKIIKRFGPMGCAKSQGAYMVKDSLIPISVEGSLFFDYGHGAGAVGFKAKDGTSLHPDMVWEIHPVTKISFPKK